jgi:hypothetical protein
MYEEEEEAPAGTYDIPPSRMGFQNLLHLMQSAHNKGKIPRADQSKYEVAVRKWEMGHSTKSQKLKDDAKDELRDIYRRLFYKKPKF